MNDHKFQYSLNGTFSVCELEVKFKRRKYPTVHITSSMDVWNFLRPLLSELPRERLVVLSMSPNNDILGLEYVSMGTSTSSTASPREAFKAPMLTNASAVIVAHNHPSGNVVPSKDDKQVCINFARAAKVLDMQMLDFVILSKLSYTSYADTPEKFE